MCLRILFYIYFGDEAQFCQKGEGVPIPKTVEKALHSVYSVHSFHNKQLSYKKTT